MKVLVTGSAGYIGRHLVKDLSDWGWDVEGIDVIPTYTQRQLQADLYFDRQKVRRWMEDKDIIFHLAALTPKNSKPFLDQWWRYNVGVTYALLHYLKPTQALVYTSTLGVKREWDHMYAYSKHASEGIFTLFKKPTAIARLGNVWGRGGNGVLDLWIQQAIANEDIIIHTNQRRDFVHVSDVCQALIIIAEYLLKNTYATQYQSSLPPFEVGHGYPWDIEIFAKTIRTCAESGSKYVMEEHDPSIVRADSDRLKGIGWKPKYLLPDCIPQEIEWYRE